MVRAALVISFINFILECAIPVTSCPRDWDNKAMSHPSVTSTAMPCTVSNIDGLQVCILRHMGRHVMFEDLVYHPLHHGCCRKRKGLRGDYIKEC
eukprot:4994010-Ditylum_brightwellii.AAC.1